MNKTKTTTICLLLFCLSIMSFSYAQVTNGQLVSILKTIKPDLKVIGVLSTSIGDKEIASITRASQAQGMEVFIGQPGDPREVSEIYKKLVSQKKVQIIIIPSTDDKMLLNVAFEFLAENSVLDKIGLCVPSQEQLTQGAFCHITKESGKFTAYINQRVSALVGASIPAESPTITFVSR